MIVDAVAGRSPNFTVAPAMKPVPEIVTGSPPTVEPVAGFIELMVGTGAFAIALWRYGEIGVGTVAMALPTMGKTR